MKNVDSKLLLGQQLVQQLVIWQQQTKEKIY